MIEFLAMLMTSPSMPLVVLFGVCLIVIWEAVRCSRRALWGDMFAEDGDE